MVRRIDHRAVLGLAGAGLALTFATAGCEASVSSGSAASPAPDGGAGASGKAGASAGASAPAPAGADAPSTPGASAPDASGTCGADDLQVKIEEDEDGFAFNIVAVLKLTNTSSTTCVVPKGWVPLGVREGDGYRELSTMRENHPDAGADISLKPGGTAYAGITWTSGTDCPDIGEFAIKWDGTWLRAPGTWVEQGPNEGGRPAVCEARPVQGTFQPTIDGVDHW